MKITFIPMVFSLFNPRVFVAVAMFCIHHHFVLELLHRLGDLKTEVFFETWINRGMYLALIVAVVVNYWRSVGKKNMSEETKLIK